MRIRVCWYKNAGVAGYAEAFRPVQSDSQTSEWYSYFENDVPECVLKMLYAKYAAKWDVQIVEMIFQSLILFYHPNRDCTMQIWFVFLFCFLFMSTTQSVFARALANIRWYG